MFKLTFKLQNADDTPAVNVPVQIIFSPKSVTDPEILPRDYLTDENGEVFDDNIPGEYNISVISNLIPAEIK